MGVKIRRYDDCLVTTYGYRTHILWVHLNFVVCVPFLLFTLLPDKCHFRQLYLSFDESNLIENGENIFVILTIINASCYSFVYDKTFKHHEI